MCLFGFYGFFSKLLFKTWHNVLISFAESGYDWRKTLGDAGGADRRILFWKAASVELFEVK